MMEILDLVCVGVDCLGSVTHRTRGERARYCNALAYVSLGGTLRIQNVKLVRFLIVDGVLCHSGGDVALRGIRVECVCTAFTGQRISKEAGDTGGTGLGLRSDKKDAQYNRGHYILESVHGAGTSQSGLQ